MSELNIEKYVESEVWKEIEREGFGIYEVSSWGRVRTRSRIYQYSDGTERSYKRYIRKLFICARGFVSVTLLDSVNNRARTFRVHRLVAEHFLPRYEGSRHVLHVDGNKRNNNVSNLLWVSHINKGNTYLP